MPDFRVRDPETGRTVTLRGDSPPTEAELEQIFSALGPPPSAALPPMQPMASHATDPRAKFMEQIDSAERMDGPLLPPWAGVVAAGNAARTVGGRAVEALKTFGSNAARGGGAVVAQEAMDAVGVPKWISVPASIAIGRRGQPSPAPAAPRAPRAAPTPRPPASAAGWATRANPSPSAAPVSPAASTRVAPTPSPSPVAATVPPPAAAVGPPSAPIPQPPSGTPAGVAGWSPQRIQNELGIQARRMKAQLSEQEYSQAADLVRQGMPPPAAIAKTVALRPPAAAPKFKLAGAETRVYGELRRQGKSHADALQAIEQQRQLAAALGTPSSETVRQSVAQRNTTGRWSPPKADEAARRDARKGNK